MEQGFNIWIAKFYLEYGDLGEYIPKFTLTLDEDNHEDWDTLEEGYVNCRLYRLIPKIPQIDVNSLRHQVICGFKDKPTDEELKLVEAKMKKVLYYDILDAYTRVSRQFEEKKRALE